MYPEVVRRAAREKVNVNNVAERNKDAGGGAAAFSLIILQRDVVLPTFHAGNCRGLSADIGLFVP